MKNGNKLICMVFVFAIIGWVYPTDNDGAIWVVNNTNLAPFVAGHGGTGERIGDNTTYWANNSPLQILLFSHANASGQNGEIHLYINGTKVSDTSGRPLGIAEENNKTIIATIPQYANYSVEMVNFHHYEWREYPILSGEVTTNILTSTGTGTGCTGNCSFDVISVNAITKNNTSDSYGADIALFQRLANITNDAITQTYSFMSLENGEFEISSTNTTTGNSTDIFSTPELWQVNAGNTYASQISLTHNNLQEIINGTIYNYNKTYFDMGGANTTNVNNTNMTGDLNIVTTNHTQRTTLMEAVGTFQMKDNNTLRSALYSDGTQDWKLRTALGVEAGYIQYATPGSLPGIIYWNSSGSMRTNMRLTSVGYQISASNTSSSNPNGTVFGTQAEGSSITIQSLASNSYQFLVVDSTGKIIAVNLSGTGNAYVCVNSTSYPYRGAPGC